MAKDLKKVSTKELQKELVRRANKPLVKFKTPLSEFRKEMMTKYPQCRYIVAEYSGSGDDGGINTVLFSTEGTIESLEETPGGLEVDEQTRQTLTKMAYDILEKHYPGWENNEGASGEMHFNLARGTVKIEHTHYFTESKSSSAEDEF